jgi:hypothetical protein
MNSIFEAIRAAQEAPSPRLLLLDATALLLEWGELEAARILFACELGVEPPTRYAGTPTGGLCLKIVCPSQLSDALEDSQRPEGWAIRKALEHALPPPYSIEELFVQGAPETWARAA